MTNDLLQSENSLFLSGPFGAGKTTAAIERIRWLLARERIRGDDILVLVPQRTLGRPYHDFLRQPERPAGPPVRVTTFAGLARAAVELFWPLLAPAAGYVDSHREPTFLNLETAQYHMARLVDDAFEEGAFDAVRLRPNRVVSQVLDNLNKGALHGFSIDQVYERLELAVPQGEQLTARLNVLRTAKRISHAFRRLCLEQSLVDFSLWVELFLQHALTNEWSRTRLFRSHRHLIVDNVEEDTFAAHELIRQWLPHLESALIVSDDDGGFRLFLGADPANVASLAAACDHQLRWDQSHVTPQTLRTLSRRVDRAIRGAGAKEASADGRGAPDADLGTEPPQPEDAAAALPLHYSTHRFYPQMIDWAVDEIERLIDHEGMRPGAIAVLAPYVSDALRFSLQSRLTDRGIASTSHRPSRALNVEPAARALLTLADLAHPLWQRYPQPADVTLTLGVAIAALDPVRAHLLSRTVYGTRGTVAGELRAFSGLQSAVQQRITYTIGETYSRLRAWIYSYRSATTFVPIDQFFARLFGELLSQPQFGFHQDTDAARVASQLVASARNFRWAVEEELRDGDADGVRRATIGRAYVQLVESGALGALYVPGWSESDEAVFIGPAYTYLMRNRPVDVQFWLDIGTGGWWERLYQPLTHPYVLSHAWPAAQLWSDFDEFSSRQQTMRRLVIGLLRRTRRAVYLGMSDYGESGMEDRGPLLNLLNRVLVQHEN